MPMITVVLGLFLSACGAYFYLTAQEPKSPTALIPAFIGVPFILLGLLSFKDKIRKHAMHLAAMIGLLGFLGGAYKGFPNLPKLISGELEGKDFNKALSQNILALACLVFVLLCINSFVKARLLRKQTEATSSSNAPK
jgi:Na+/H+ antiporter NhaD/arsenite permease-like protein